MDGIGPVMSTLPDVSRGIDRPIEFRAPTQLKTKCASADGWTIVEFFVAEA
jgi:hypothetical protein